MENYYWKVIEIQFMSQNELINIIPNFSSPSLNFISGNYGPFQPLIPIQLPLWIALELKKNKKCKIETPYWMEIDFLKKILEFEKSEENSKEFEELPFHYFEIALQLLEYASEDISNVEQIRTLLEDIWITRTEKIRSNLLKFNSNITGIKLNRLSALEINRIKPLSIQVMNQLYSFNLIEEENE